MKKDFELAFGSITGNDHKRSGRNNQDAFHWFFNEIIVAVVCDGCGDSRNSEVGAKIGAQLTVETIRRNIGHYKVSPWETILEKSKNDILAQLRVLSMEMGGHLSQIVIDYFLFTIIGTVITPQETIIFSFGDGVFVLNDEIMNIGPFPNNEPPYLAYSGLLESSLGEYNPNLLKFQIHRVLPTSNVKVVLIGTDGVSEINKISDLRLPGREELVGDLSQFWLNDHYFQNRDMVRRKLALINREVVKPIWEEKCLAKEKGLLSDDTTLIVIRRNPLVGEEG